MLKKLIKLLFSLSLAFFVLFTSESMASNDLDYQYNQTIPKELSDKLQINLEKEKENGKLYPDYFGGMYIDDNNILVIKVTTDEAKIKIQNILGRDGYRIDLVKFSYNQLQEYAENFAKKNDVQGFSVDIRNNRARIYTDNETLILAKDELRTNNFNRSSKLNTINLDIKKSSEEIPGITIEEISNVENEAGVIGGSDIKSGIESLTVGFSGYYGSRPAIISAGHARFSVGDTVNYDGRLLGKVIFKNFYNNAYGEFSIIEVTNPYFKISNVIRYKNGEYRRLRAVDTNPVEGLYVSKYGKSTKDSVVQIKDANYRDLMEKKLIKGRVLCRIVRGDSAKGDSGGPYYHYKNNKYYALGIHNGSRIVNGVKHTSFTRADAYNGIFSTKITD